MKKTALVLCFLFSFFCVLTLTAGEVEPLNSDISQIEKTVETISFPYPAYTVNKITPFYIEIPSQFENPYAFNYFNPYCYLLLPVNSPITVTSHIQNEYGSWVSIEYNGNIYYSRIHNISTEPVEENYDYSDYYNHEYMADNIYVDCIIEKEYAEELLNYIDMIPDYIIDSYDGVITLTSNYVGILTNQDKDNSLIGAYKIDDKNIYINYSFMDSILHEFGHYYFYCFLDVTEFQAIYDEEFSDSGLGKYYTDSMSEYFAQAFELTILNDDTFKSAAPKTFNFISNILEKKL